MSRHKYQCHKSDIEWHTWILMGVTETELKCVQIQLIEQSLSPWLWTVNCFGIQYHLSNFLQHPLTFGWWASIRICKSQLLLDYCINFMKFLIHIHENIMPFHIDLLSRYPLNVFGHSHLFRSYVISAVVHKFWQTYKGNSMNSCTISWIPPITMYFCLYISQFV